MAGDNALLKSLEIERIDVNLFRSTNLRKPHPMARAVFGGHIIAQAMVAAQRTIDNSELSVHSFHSYFLLAGNPDIPAIYHVERIRDGRSFSTRSVLVKQNGKAIFSAQISFHRPELTPLDHYQAMPEGIPPPEQCPTSEEYTRRCMEEAERAGDTETVETYKMLIAGRKGEDRAVLTRYTNPTDSLMFYPLQSTKNRMSKEPRVGKWMKVEGALPDAEWLHNVVVAYGSDYDLMRAAARPLGAPHTTYTMLASLDHSMWFHAPIRADEWMYVDIECPRASEGRAVMRAHIYNQKGELAVTVAQEALMRLAKPKAKL